MKTIMGKGTVGLHCVRWLALVPDDATSCGDARRLGTIDAPHNFDVPTQTAWLEGYAAAIKDIDRKQKELHRQCAAIGLLPPGGA